VPQPYSITSAMLARRRALRDSDPSRFGSIRLVVQTQGLTQAVCSVVKERIGGGRIDGSRLAFAQISRVRSDGRPLTDLELLQRALEALAADIQG
jgi:hypothetical protein